MQIFKYFQGSECEGVSSNADCRAGRGCRLPVQEIIIINYLTEI